VEDFARGIGHVLDHGVMASARELSGLGSGG
jgi:hypothetical protein